MRYIDSWLTGLGLDYIIPKLKANGITTPKKLALLSLRDMYEVVGVEDAEDRKKLYFLIQRLQTVGLLVGRFCREKTFYHGPFRMCNPFLFPCPSPHLCSTVSVCFPMSIDRF